MDPSVNFNIPIFKTLPTILRNNYEKKDNKYENQDEDLKIIDITKIQNLEPFTNNKRFYLTFILFGIILGIFLFRYFFSFL